ncbi:hypothetical protein P175DRAFT_0497944 [Aspergillus ochraceoroseus IBT 24754]|uniref:Uncharacterized protein n=1 Tax=Aspergillus ochraceoroseus IBT 24754 TaxID=1392256 RepID=A0A2T5M8I0_9EURO|nr:uncharacterized protein P175DRAFT_0497944 [Aspergillus ochraceoroseus IBT 24754]PTU24835.1 hypothetical protein P175DRAFT_0497944 [Aspergillus ochraceoroseus IBT 24754]
MSSCLSGLLSCCLPTSCSPKSTTAAKQSPSVPHEDTNGHTSSPSRPNMNQLDDGYTQVVPLPRYTARPMSIREKTLEAHMRDHPISSDQLRSSMIADEKQRLAWEESASPDYSREEVTSDVSSAISFPSSYGNTSTATRETPPPPYSPPPWSPAPSRSMSISSAYRPLPISTITPPPPVFQRPEGTSSDRHTPPRRSIDGQLSRPRRFSWESR